MQIDLNEKMEAVAGRGKFHLIAIIYHSDYERRRKALFKEGFALAQMPTTNDAVKAKYNISWKRCEVKNLPKVWDSDTIIKERLELTQGQRLWLLSTEANNQKTQKM